MFGVFLNSSKMANSASADIAERSQQSPAALVDVPWVHVLDDLDPRAVQHAHAAAGTQRKVLRTVEQLTVAGHLHRDAVVDGVDVHLGDVG